MEAQLTGRPYTIGLDLGGTNAVFGIVDGLGNIVEHTSIKTQEYDTAEAFVDAAVKALMPIIDKVGGINTIEGMGIGAPNSNYYDGTIAYAPNIAWAHECVVPFAKMFNERLSIPVSITNDANAAALGEIAYGNAGGMRDFIMVTLGTGLGSGFVAGGRMIYGHDGMAGELGHVVVEPGGRQCGCGRRGCLETYVSATGAKRTAFELMARETVPSVLRDVPYDKFDARIITEAAQKGDSLALEVFRCTAERLGRALANAVAITSSEAVFFFGGLAQAGELLLEPTRRYLEENLLPVYRGNVKVLPSGIPAQNAAILGASALIWNE